jgi:small ligand-binding sensory domain FIST
MRPFLCAHATHPDWALAAELVLAQLRAQLASRAMQATLHADEPACPGLGLLYITDAYAPHAQGLLDHLMDALPDVTDWVGTVGVGVAASGVEYFDEPALAVLLVDLPPDRYRVFSGVLPLSAALPSGAGRFRAATALVHADAATPDVAELVAELAQRTRTGAVFGGLSSGRSASVQFAHSSQGAREGLGASPGVLQGGLSGVAFADGVTLHARVTQGCTPVGPTRTVTAADRNVVLTLDGEDALDVLLHDLDIDLGEPQKAMVRLRRTLAGLAPAAPVQAMQRLGGRCDPVGSDVRVRHLLGLDPHRQAVALADTVAVGERLMFCTRDAQAARADLMRICAELRDEVESADTPGGGRMCGAVYVSCAGRGGAHFGAPNAELQTVRRVLGDVPLVGFFAGGEIAHQQLYGYSGVLLVFVSNGGV